MLFHARSNPYAESFDISMKRIDHHHDLVMQGISLCCVMCVVVQVADGSDFEILSRRVGTQFIRPRKAAPQSRKPPEPLS